MDEVTVKRWRRHGQDRLYVNAADSTTLGWVDLHSGRITTTGATASQIAEAVSTHPAWRSDSVPDDSCMTGIVPAPRPFPDPESEGRGQRSPGELGLTRARPAEPRLAGVEPAEVADLATARAGEGMRRLAAAERRAHPIRTGLARLFRIHTQERAWRIGAVGEEATGRQLAKLNDTWHVLHGIPVGRRGSDIDHLVIGPAGVFTINTKCHPDKQIWVGGNTILINGSHVPYVRNASFEARRSRALLAAATDIDSPVTAVIATISDRLLVKTPPDGIAVIEVGALRRWLLQQPSVQSPETSQVLYDAARSRRTWLQTSRLTDRMREGDPVN